MTLVDHSTEDLPVDQWMDRFLNDDLVQRTLAQKLGRQEASLRSLTEKTTFRTSGSLVDTRDDGSEEDESDSQSEYVSARESISSDEQRIPPSTPASQGGNSSTAVSVAKGSFVQSPQNTPTVVLQAPHTVMTPRNKRPDRRKKFDRFVATSRSVGRNRELSPTIEKDRPPELETAFEAAPLLNIKLDDSDVSNMEASELTAAVMSPFMQHMRTPKMMEQWMSYGSTASL